MALTANAIPSQVPYLISPFDAQLAFGQAQVIAASGYINNLNSGQIDFGGASPGAGSAGRKEGVWALNITAIDLVTTDEAYQFALLGSNDVAFGNGNVQLLAFHDIAALPANRVIPNILGGTTAAAALPFGKAGIRLAFPFVTLAGEIVYRYLRCRVTLPAAGSSVTVSSWVSRCEIKF